MKEIPPFDFNAPPTFSGFFTRLFTNDFMPHGHCYFWRPEILWLHVFSDIATALAYYSIPIALIYFILKRRDVPFSYLFVMFGAFIFLCGTSHLVDVWTTWYPAYRFEGIVKLMTALASVATAIALVPQIPRAINFPSMENLLGKTAEKSRVLSETNKQLKEFNRVAIGREKRILELKREVNQLAAELGRPNVYKYT